MSKLHPVFSLGLTVTAAILTPVTTLAASFDYDQVTLFSARPIESDSVLSFFGDVSNNEGYTLVNNIDRTASDSGHVSTAKNALPGGAGYYTMGRDASPDPNTAGERSATLEGIEGFPNFTQYLQDNNIPLSSIGYSYGPKEGLDFTKAISLGEDILGQDWLATPDSPIEERIYQTDPDDTNSFITLGTTPLVTYFSPTYFAVDNGDTTDFTDNLNVFLGDPTRPSKVEGLAPLESGLADAFLEDVAAGGGLVQEISEEILKPDQVETSLVEINGETYDVTYIGFPIEIRAVGDETVAVPESPSTLALMLLTGCGILIQVKRRKRSDRANSWH